MPRTMVPAVIRPIQPTVPVDTGLFSRGFSERQVVALLERRALGLGKAPKDSRPVPTQLLLDGRHRDRGRLLVVAVAALGPKPVTASVVAELLGRKASVVEGSLRRMARAGWLDMTGDGQRSFALAATPPTPEP